MSLFDFKERDVVRVKVKLCEDAKDPVYKKFAIDPRITNFEVLQRLLTRGFDLKMVNDFNISYLVTDDYGDQFYLPLLSDWDLDAAILTAADPTLRLKLQLRPIEEEQVKGKNKGVWNFSGGSYYSPYNQSFEEVEDNYPLLRLEDWDIVVPGEVPLSAKNLQSIRNSFLSHLSHQYEKTVNSVQRVIGSGKPEVECMNYKPAKPPMNDSEFRNFMDSIGRIINPHDFRHGVYLGGFEPSLRKVGWRLLLDIYPVGMNGRERLEFMQQRSNQYKDLKDRWKQLYKEGKLHQAQLSMISLISVDVVRTDRNHSFYSGSKNQHRVSELFDLLVTFSIYHPSVGYSQGMSDLASPILYVQTDESAAYVCFCSLMSRLSANFAGDGHAMITKLQHFHDLTVFQDPEFAQFLRKKELGDMFFAHRWLVLELKREFLFEDVLRIMEIQWASLPDKPSLDRYNGDLPNDKEYKGVPMVEDGVSLDSLYSPLASVSCAHDAYVRAQSLRRYSTHGHGKKRDSQKSCCQNSNSFLDHIQLTNSLIDAKCHSPTSSRSSYVQSTNIPEFQHGGLFESRSSSTRPTFNGSENSDAIAASYDSRLFNDDDQISFDKSESNDHSGSFNTSCDDGDAENGAVAHGDTTPALNHGLIVMKDGVVELPPPEKFGYGNPFLLYLCLSLLLEYREPLMKSVNEMFDFAIFFRKLNQKHNTERILNRARSLYDAYLKDQEIKRRRLDQYPELEISL